MEVASLFLTAFTAVWTFYLSSVLIFLNLMTYPHHSFAAVHFNTSTLEWMNIFDVAASRPSILIGADILT